MGARLVSLLVSLLVSVPVLALASPARASPELSLELGYVRNRVTVSEHTALDGQAARFTMRLSRGHLHAGAEAEEGRLHGTTTLPNGVVARTTEPAGSPSRSTSSPLEGNTLGLKLFAGAHTNVGRLRVGGDLAGGMRDSWVSSDLGPDVAGYKYAPLVEVRSRIDVWLTPRVTLGAVATADLLQRRDVSLGATLALHFPR